MHDRFTRDGILKSGLEVYRQRERRWLTGMFLICRTLALSAADEVSMPTLGIFFMRLLNSCEEVSLAQDTMHKHYAYTAKDSLADGNSDSSSQGPQESERSRTGCHIPDGHRRLEPNQRCLVSLISYGIEIQSLPSTNLE
jgi:hypothetical protein